MAFGGVLDSCESVRRWCEKFGHLYAAGVRRRRARTGDKWHLDEVFLNINGERHYLWRAVDQNGVVIDILVQPKRDRFRENSGSGTSHDLRTWSSHIKCTARPLNKNLRQKRFRQQVEPAVHNTLFCDYILGVTRHKQDWEVR